MDILGEKLQLPSIEDVHSVDIHSSSRYIHVYAQMAELVDALGSGPSGGNTVQVRVLFWA